jgi:hypothetical protein
MVSGTRRLVVALLVALAPAGTLAAQIDYRNLDPGRPLRVTDAVAVEQYAFEASLPWRLATGGGGSAHVVAPEVGYGLARNLVVGLELELVADRSGSLPGESHAALSVFYNARRETVELPAISLAVEVGQATAAPLGRQVAATFTGIASRSLGRSRLHLNGSIAPLAPDETGRWWAGLAWDYTLYRTSTLLAIEAIVEDRPARPGASVAVAAGLRRQLAPTLVIQGGVRRRLDADPGATELTVGFSHAFGIAALLPGWRP